MSVRILPFIVLSLWLWTCQNERPADLARQAVQLKVTAAAVQRADMIDTVRFYGQVALRDEILLSSQFDGRLNDFHLYLGDRVRQGQRIAEIIPPQREALMQVLPNIDADLRPVLEKQMRTIPLISPLNGTVLKLYLHNGDVLQKGQPIVQIGNLDVLNVIGELPVHALPLAQKQSAIQARFIDFPHGALVLPVEAIGGRVNQQTQTIPVRLSLSNPEHLFRPGLRVLLSFPGQVHRNALVIPRSALLEKEGVYSAFTVQNGRVKERVLKIGLKQPQRVEVLAGLHDGELVVTKKAYSLVDGMEVRLE